MTCLTRLKLQIHLTPVRRGPLPHRPFCALLSHQLWVIQRGGASLLVLVTAVALPLQQLVLCTPALVGKWAEAFFWGDGIALLLVLAGFLMYQLCSSEGRAARAEARAAEAQARVEGRAEAAHPAHDPAESRSR